MAYTNLDKSPSFKALVKYESARQFALKDSITEARLQSYQSRNGPLTFHYGSTEVDDTVLSFFQKISEEQELIAQYKQLLQGEKTNVSENRKALHHATRRLDDPSFYSTQWALMTGYVTQVRDEVIRSFSNKKFNAVVHIGIGGSELGPKMLYTALRSLLPTTAGDAQYPIHFLSSVGPEEFKDVIHPISVEETLFIVASKSGSTLETLANWQAIKTHALGLGIAKDQLRLNSVSVTSPNSPLDNDNDFSRRFYIDENIGGRFSATSMMGALSLSLSFGVKVVRDILDGAHEMDQFSEAPNCLENGPLLDALLMMWDRNVKGYPGRAIIPYSHPLRFLPSHLQQLICESNGKSVNRYSEPVSYATSPIIFGNAGTNTQHSYFQMLHQGPSIIPVQFILVKKLSAPDEAPDHHKLMCSNALAQMMALAQGNTDDNLNLTFSGNRPSSLLALNELTPFTLGSLLSYYENMTMFSGFLWNLNSFDQEGVSLGKAIAAQLLDPNANIDDGLRALWHSVLGTEFEI